MVVWLTMGFGVGSVYASVTMCIRGRRRSQRASERWVVRYSNYEPAEIDSSWPTEVEAGARAAALNANGNDMWAVERWT
jgi:hypothetical protein